LQKYKKRILDIIPDTHIKEISFAVRNSTFLKLGEDWGVVARWQGEKSDFKKNKTRQCRFIYLL